MEVAARVNVGFGPISLVRGKGLSIWLGVQSLAQPEACCGRTNAQSILTNCATKLALGGLDVETADFFSRTLGEGSVVLPRRTWQKNRFALVALTTSDSVPPKPAVTTPLGPARTLPVELPTLNALTKPGSAASAGRAEGR